MSALLIALLIALNVGASAPGARITIPVHERGNVVVAWDSKAPGQGWVHVERFEDGSFSIDIQREFTPRKALLKKWRSMHRHAIERAIRAHR